LQIPAAKNVATNAHSGRGINSTATHAAPVMSEAKQPNHCGALIERRSSRSAIKPPSSMPAPMPRPMVSPVQAPTVRNGSPRVRVKYAGSQLTGPKIR